MERAPPASFLDMMLLAMSGMESTVAVTSRSAYSLPSAGTSSGLWPTSAAPMRSTCRRISSSGISTRKPGMASSLSRVPPVWPRPRPLIFTNAAPAAAISGTSTMLVLSPTPPVLCLSTVGRPIPSHSSSRPLATMARVMASVSASDIPCQRTAISHADTW